MRQQNEYTLTTKDYSFPGQFLKAARESKGLSQREAAFKAGMSPSALCRLESGERMLPRNLLELTDILGVNPRELKKYIPKKKELSSLEMLKKSFPNNWERVLKDCMKEIN